MKHLLMLFFCSMLLLYQSSRSATSYGLSTDVIAGSEQLRAGEYEEALAALLADTAITDSAYHFFKRALGYHHLQHYGKAIGALRQVCRWDTPLIAPAYELIG